MKNNFFRYWAYFSLLNCIGALDIVYIAQTNNNKIESLTHYFAMSQDDQTHIKNLAAFATRFLVCLTILRLCERVNLLC